MSKISIHAYHERIDRLIEESRLVEAAAHCRHILSQYPRHVATYRLLGKAFLEQQRFNSAVDVFQRVLSADPEDFIAHIGLSIAYKAEQVQAQAIWHMERAFEIDPYNAIIQDELKALYAQRDGIAPERLSLTPGALARLHYRSGLYPQAIAAARELLAAAPSRVDLQALLAEALWRDDQRVDAVDICLDLLETLPNCIKANAILAEVWLLTGRTREAHDYLQRLQPLTLLDREYTALETPVGSAFNVEGSLPLPDVALVDELDEADLVLEEEGALAGVDWVGELTRLDAAGDLGDVDWFEETPDVNWFQTPQLAADAAAVDVPDWLREISEEAGVDLFATAAAPTGVVESPELAAEDILSFLAEMENEAEREQIKSEDAVEPVALPGGDFTDWLDQTLVEHGEGEAGEAVMPLPMPYTPDPEMLANLPDWLQESEMENEALPADARLLQELAAIAGQEDEAQPTDDEIEPDTIPAAAPELQTVHSSDLSTWLDEMVDDVTGERTDALAIEAQASAEPEFEVREMNENDDPTINRPDTPDEDAPELAGSVEPLMPAEIDSELDDIPDWLQVDLDNQEDLDALPDWLQPPPSDAYLEDAELPGWLKTPTSVSAPEKMPESLPPTPLTDAADLTWLDEIAAGKGAALEEPLTLRWPDAASADDAATPAWLDELAQVDWEPTDESVDWLAEMAAEAAGAEAAGAEAAGAETAAAEAAAAEAAAAEAAAAETTGAEEESAASAQVDESDIFANVPDDPEAAMAWLEQLAARQGAPLEELPTVMRMPPTEVETDTAAPLVEAEMDQPEQAAADAPVTAWDIGPDAFAGESESAPTAAELAAAEMFAAQIPEDPEAAMAWLEMLAARQGAPLEELPTVRQSAGISPPASEPVAEEWAETEMPADLFAAQIPDDPEAAIAWLEQLGALPDAPVAELPTLSEWPEPEAEEDAPADLREIVEETAPTAAEMSEAEAFAAQIPEDPEEAMAWLEMLAARQGAPLAELPTMMEKPELAQPEPALAVETPSPAPIAVAISPVADMEIPGSVLDEEPPDNSAAALAWLVQLALLDDEDEAPAKLAVTPEPLTAAAEVDLDWLMTGLAAEPGLPAAEPVAEQPTPAAPEEEPAYDWVGLSEQELAESLPDWLSTETVKGDTSWLDDLGEVNLDDWLAAEEQALEQRTDFALPETDELAAAVMPPLPDEGMPAAVAADLDMAKLNQARAAVDAGNIQEALTLYRSLMAQGADLPLLVSDLEAASTRHRRQPLLRRLLGDAYMQQGELQKALNVYREVMDHL